MIFLKVTICAWCCWAVTASGDDDLPVGHKMKLGSHRPMEGRVEELDVVPHPIDFYEEYSLGSKPVVLKGAARNMPAFKLWSDKYMKENYGDEEVQVEPGKKENRTRVAMEGTSMGFGEFLDEYNTSDVYMVDGVPKPMTPEFMMLRCTLCGGYTKYLSMTNFWFSSGGTKSVLHNDDADNINCVLSGSKEFFMAHKKYEKDLPFTRSGHVGIDVDAVDLIQTPSIRKLKWWLAEIEAGDCLFIPHFWLHQVRSTGRNLAVNVWWHFFRNFNNSECMTTGEDGVETRQELPQYAPLADFMINEGESHRKRYVEAMYPTNARKPRKFTKKDIIALTIDAGEDDLPSKEQLKQAKEIGTKIFNAGNTNGDKYLDLKELYSIDADLFLELFGEPKGGYGLEDLQERQGEEEIDGYDDLGQGRGPEEGGETTEDLELDFDDEASQPRDEL